MSDGELERGPDDPVSWFVIEKGWKVADRDGGELGSVAEVIGDTRVDIFDGLAVSSGLLGKPRYVPAERVGTITPGCVRIELTKEEFERLGDAAT